MIYALEFPYRVLFPTEKQAKNKQIKTSALLRQKRKVEEILKTKFSNIQSIGAPRSGALRSGAALRVAGARSERRSGLLAGALLGAPLRKWPER